MYRLQTATPHNAAFAVVKLAQRSIYVREWQAGEGVGEGSGMWGEFLPLCLDPLQPDDASHAISPCLNFQSVKRENSRSHASDFFDTGEGQSTVLLQFMAQLCPAHPSTLHSPVLDVGNVGGQAEKQLCSSQHWLCGHGKPREQLDPALSTMSTEGVYTRRRTSRSWYYF